MARTKQSSRKGPTKMKIALIKKDAASRGREDQTGEENLNVTYARAIKQIKEYPKKECPYCPAGSHEVPIDSTRCLNSFGFFAPKTEEK